MKQFMDSLMLEERQRYPCPNVDVNDYDKTYTECSPELGDLMYSVVKDKNKSYIFPFVCANKEGVKYVAVFMWKYTESYEVNRIIIRSGFRLAESEEESFLVDLDFDYECDKTVYENFLTNVKRDFPEWNVVDYGPNHISDLIEHIYYASHPGPRSILVKAQLLEIGRKAHCIPSFNLSGRTVEEVIGRIDLTKDMLKILSTPMFVDCLFSNEKTEAFISAYKLCSGVITNQDGFNEQINFILNFQKNSKWTDRIIKKQNEECCLVYGNEQYIVISANSTKEIIEEAIIQHNCLVNWLDSVACGSIRILFLRRTEDMKKPFVSLIVWGSSIVNVYDEYNRLPDIDVFDFLLRYKNAVGLIFEPDEIILSAFEDIDFTEGYSQKQLDELKDYSENYKRESES